MSDKKCTCCEGISEDPRVIRSVTLADGEGVVLDVVYFCASCWSDRIIEVRDKSIDV